MTIHIYAQKQFHDTAYIVGTPEGLKALRDAIDKALGGEVDTCLKTTTSDGEEYNLWVVTESFMWNFLQMPYTDKELHNSEKTLPPWELILKSDGEDNV